MSEIPDNLKYTKDHEWVRVEEDGTVTVGITDYAQSSLGDITFVELPHPDESFGIGDSFGVVESVKAASDLYMPISGKIIESNEAIENSPEAVNNSPYEDAWLVRVLPDDPSQLDGLMDSTAYADIVG